VKYSFPAEPDAVMDFCMFWPAKEKEREEVILPWQVCEAVKKHGRFDESK
jgi:hypothetical protein